MDSPSIFLSINPRGIAAFASRVQLAPGAIQSLSVAPDRIVLDIRVEDAVVGLELRPKQGAAGFVALVRDQPPSNDALQTTLASLEQRLRNVSMAALHAELKRFVDVSATRSEQFVPPRLDRFFKQPDHRLDWYRFCYPERLFLDANARLPGTTVKLEHKTLECLHGNLAHAVPPSLRLFADSYRFSGDGGAKTFVTNIGQRDVLGGKTQERLEGVLTSAVETCQPSFVHLSTTCLPELLGDDPAFVMKTLSAKHPVRFLWTSKTRPAEGSLKDVVREQMAAVRWPDDRDRRAVLVAGLLSDDAHAEALRLLGALGATVVGRLLPSLDLLSIPGVADARAVILVNPGDWAAVDASWFAPDLELFAEAAPIGQRGTLEWLAKMAEALGVPAAGAIAQTTARFEEALSPVRANAQSIRVGLVGDAADMKLLTLKGQLGFSVAHTLCELGFQVRCMGLQRKGEQEMRRAVRTVAQGTIDLRPFSTPGELDDMLKEDVDVVFTHLNHDARLMAHGLHGFCDQVFGVGVAGMVTAADTIVRRARARTPRTVRQRHTPWQTRP